jgi:hypothetical protein
MEASPAPPPPAAEPKAKRVKRDLPTGIIYNPAKNKYQARIKGRNDKSKLVQIDRPIPGLFDTSDEAVEKQAAAQQKWDAGEAVWPAHYNTTKVVTNFVTKASLRSGLRSS